MIDDYERFLFKVVRLLFLILMEINNLKSIILLL